MMMNTKKKKKMMMMMMTMTMTMMMMTTMMTVPVESTWMIRPDKELSLDRLSSMHKNENQSVPSAVVVEMEIMVVVWVWLVLLLLPSLLSLVLHLLVQVMTKGICEFHQEFLHRLRRCLEPARTVISVQVTKVRHRHQLDH
jgi:hypothetical protein